MNEVPSMTACWQVTYSINPFPNNRLARASWRSEWDHTTVRTEVLYLLYFTSIPSEGA